VTWTYSDPAGDRKDEVRLLVGDTDTTDQMVSDEEIDYVLTQYVPDDGRPAWLAGAHTCDIIAAKFGRQMQQSIGSLSRQAQMKFDHYRTLATDLRMLWATGGLGNAGMIPAEPVLGGGGKTYLGTNPYMNPEGL
jgi:hypothetical protein